MYLVKELKKKYNFSSINIPNQSAIKEKTGSELDLNNAYEYVRSKSDNFTIENEYARNIDKLCSEIINSNASSKDEIPVIVENEEIVITPIENKEEVSEEKQKVLTEIEDIKSLIDFDFYDGDDLIKLEKELEDLEGLLEYL